MNLLLDTHTALWVLLDDRRLSRRADQLLGDPRSPVLLSAAVAWEIAIKRSTGKLNAPQHLVQMLLERRALPLPITIEHAEAAGALPPIHRDPFDRMLIAQAQIEDAVIVSADPALRDYDVRVEW